MSGRFEGLSAAAALALGFLAHSMSATAAERICEARISGGPAFATTESDARIGALTAWRMKELKPTASATRTGAWPSKKSQNAPPAATAASNA